MRRCPPHPETVQDHTTAIQGGYENPNDPAVIGLLSGPGMCSGSLIAPNLVLTAQHCVASTNSEYVHCATSKFGEVLSTTAFGVTTEWDGLERLFGHEHVKLHFASAVLIPPGDDSMCGRDVALVLLEGKGVPATEALPINPRVDEDVQAGEIYRAVGFGATSAGGAGAGVRRGSRICLDAPDPYCSVSCVSDWDCPATATCILDKGACEIRGSGDALELGGGCTLSPQPPSRTAGMISALGLLALLIMARPRRRRATDSGGEVPAKAIDERVEVRVQILD